jgi:hypothetical protein
MPTNLREIRRRMIDAADRATLETAERVKDRAVADAPFYRGALKASARVEEVDRPGGGEAEISFRARHAIREHEDLDRESPKFLEANLKAEAARYAQAIAAEVRRALR